MIMFCRFKSCSNEIHEKVSGFENALDCLYDLIFTTEKKTYIVPHAAYKSKCLIAFAEISESDINALENHITDYLRRASAKGVTVKVYTDIQKYESRLEALEELAREEDKLSPEVIRLLKEITL